MAAVALQTLDVPPETIWLDDGTASVLNSFQRKHGYGSQNLVIDQMLTMMQEAIIPAARANDEFFYVGEKMGDTGKMSLNAVFAQAAAVRPAVKGAEKTLGDSQKQGVQKMREFLDSRGIFREPVTLTDAFRCAVRVSDQIIQRLYAGNGNVTLCTSTPAGMKPCVGVAPRNDY